jgi:hypothetical protein
MTAGRACMVAGLPMPARRTAYTMMQDSSAAPTLRCELLVVRLRAQPQLQRSSLQSLGSTVRRSPCLRNEALESMAQGHWPRWLQSEVSRNGSWPFLNRPLLPCWSHGGPLIQKEYVGSTRRRARTRRTTARTHGRINISGPRRCAPSSTRRRTARFQMKIGGANRSR